jgi:hypothetical protein
MIRTHGAVGALREYVCWGEEYTRETLGHTLHCSPETSHSGILGNIWIQWTTSALREHSREYITVNRYVR